MLTLLCIILSMLAGYAYAEGYPLASLLGFIMAIIFLFGQEAIKQK